MATQLGSSYYSGKTILITGVTGFVGKVLLETILRTLPEVERIHLLIRPRRDEHGRSRTAAATLQKEVLSSSAFDTLRQRSASSLDADVAARVTAVAGDLTKEQLGLSVGDYQHLSETVDIIINSGALAVFDAPLDQALEANTLGPRRTLEFARQAMKRPFLAHISTCYVSPIGGPVFESWLDPKATPAGPESGNPFDVDDEIRAIEADVREIRRGTQPYSAWRRSKSSTTSGNGLNADEARIERQLVEAGLQRARRRGWTDTYTFTKAMGEQLLARHRGDVACLILRPSIIESARRTPAPGWIDGFRMMDPLIVGFARGQLQEFPGNPEAIMDLVPVDMVVNALLMAIPHTHLGGGPPVYQVASGMDNPLSLRQLHGYLVDYFTETPLRKGRVGEEKNLPQITFPEAATFLRRLDWRYLKLLRCVRWLHWFFGRTKRGKKRQASLTSAIKRLEKLRHTAAIYGPYAESRSRFLTFNLRGLRQNQSPDDQRIFPFTISGMSWQTYFKAIHLPGIKRYLLHLSPAVTPGDLADLDDEGREKEDGGRRGTKGKSGWERAAYSPTLGR
jgi:nucleoside-diphosphate-sugar epimerase